MEKMTTTTNSPFLRVHVVKSSDTSQLTYEPTDCLVTALNNLHDANELCKTNPNFKNIANACRKCRTAFAEFIGAVITAGSVVRNELLPTVESLFVECRNAVASGLPLLTNETEQSLADGYLRHIEDRIRLIGILQTKALPGYMKELEKELTTPESVLA